MTWDHELRHASNPRNRLTRLEALADTHLKPRVAQIHWLLPALGRKLFRAVGEDDLGLHGEDCVRWIVEAALCVAETWLLC